MNYRSCQVCLEMKPLNEENWERYNGIRKDWKRVCNECLKSTGERRLVRHNVREVDHRTYRHPLEDAFMKMKETP